MKTIRLTRDQAKQFIESYCYDPPLCGAVERLTAEPIPVKDRYLIGDVSLTGDDSCCVDQHYIDSILYGPNWNHRYLNQSTSGAQIKPVIYGTH